MVDAPISMNNDTGNFSVNDVPIIHETTEDIPPSSINSITGLDTPEPTEEPIIESEPDEPIPEVLPVIEESSVSEETPEEVVYEVEEKIEVVEVLEGISDTGSSSTQWTIESPTLTTHTEELNDDGVNPDTLKEQIKEAQKQNSLLSDTGSSLFGAVAYYKRLYVESN